MKHDFTKIGLIVIFLLISLNSWAQRWKKIEQLREVDTVNVTVRDARTNKYPYIERIPSSYGGDTIVKKRFFADDSPSTPDDFLYGYYDRKNIYKYNRILFNEKTNRYILYPAYEGFVPKKAHFTFSSKLSAGWVNRLPKRQNEYGQNLLPDNDFSWGVPISTGFDPYSLFQTSFGAINSLEYYTSIKAVSLDFRYSNATNSGIVPQSSSVTNDFKMEAGNIPLSRQGNTTMKIKANYLETCNKLTENGSNYACLFYDIATTPPDFDNSRGGYSGGKAYTNADGSEHRFTNSVDNPYRYIDNSLDKDVRRKASIGFSLAGKSWDWLVGYEHNTQNIQSGVMPYAQNMMNNANGREETVNTLNSNLQYKWKFFDDKPYYQHNPWQRLLSSTLQANYNFNSVAYTADYTDAAHLSLNRISNDLGVSWYNENAQDFGFYYRFWVNVNNSNTLNKPKVFLSDGFSFAFRFDDLSWWYGLMLKLRYSLSHTQTEAPLFYTQPYYATTLTNAEDFRDYREQYPLYRSSGLNTEKTLRNEAGIDFGDFGYHGWGSFTVNYFWNKTKRGIIPVFQNNRFELCNAVDWNKDGWEIVYKNRGRIYPDWSWNVDINFTSYKTLVKRLLTATETVPLAGFSDVSVSVLEGQPYGVIYGRQTDGTMGVIGNPTPDYTFNFNWGLSWKEWRLNCSLGYVKGGDCWNGTRNTMNYTGVSEQSAENRTARTPFDSPYYSKGVAGIAQEAIESASTVRFHTIGISYDFSKRVEIPQLTLSLGVNNLILWSAYSGVDASRPLFGYAAAQGLDYFNMPGATNFTLALTMKF